MNLLHPKEIHDGLTITSRWSRIKNTTLFEWLFMPVWVAICFAFILCGAVIIVGWLLMGPAWIIGFFPEYFGQGTWHSISLMVFLIWAWLATLYAMGK